MWCVFIRCRCSADLLLVVAAVDDIIHITFISLNWATAVRVCVGFALGLQSFASALVHRALSAWLSPAHISRLYVGFFPRSSVHMCVLSVMLCEVK